MFKRFLGNESGATAIEYGLTAALIAIALIGGATVLGKRTVHQLNCVNSVVDNIGPMSHPDCPGTF